MLVVECAVAYFDRATAELADQARHDPLTGLLNHQAFWSDAGRSSSSVRRATGTGSTLVFLDLDHFKGINDTHGHPAATACCAPSPRAPRESRAAPTSSAAWAATSSPSSLVESDTDAGEHFLAAPARTASTSSVSAGELPALSASAPAPRTSRPTAGTRTPCSSSPTRGSTTHKRAR